MENRENSEHAAYARTLARYRVGVVGLLFAVAILVLAGAGQRKVILSLRHTVAQYRSRAANEGKYLYNIERGSVIPQGSRIAIARGVYERGETILDHEMDAAKVPDLVRRELDARAHERDARHVTAVQWRSPEAAELERARIAVALARAEADAARQQTRETLAKYEKFARSEPRGGAAAPR